MINATIRFKNGTVIDVKNLTAIDVYTSRKSGTLSGELIETVNLNPQSSYAFIGESESVSVSGIDVLCVHFSKS